MHRSSAKVLRLVSGLGAGICGRDGLSVRGLVMAAATVGATVGAAHGQVIDARWLGTSPGNWSDAERWSTAPFIPNNGTPAGAQYRVLIRGDYTIQLNTPVSLYQLYLGPEGTLSHHSGDLYVDQGITLDGGTLHLFGGTVNGGVINVLRGRLFYQGNVHVGSTLLRGVTINGDIGPHLSGSHVLSIADGLTLNGTARGRFSFENSMKVTGGEFAFDLNLNTGSMQVAPGETLTLSPTTRISGGLSRGVRIGEITPTAEPNAVINHGTIWANRSGSLELWPRTFINHGKMIASDGGRLLLGYGGGFGPNYLRPTDWVNHGEIHLGPGGWLFLGGSTTTQGLGRLNRTGGSIELVGTLDNTGERLVLSPENWGMMIRDGTIIGGIVEVASPSDIDFRSATFRGITLRGEANINWSSAVFDIHEGLTLDGGLNILRPSTTFRFWGNQTLAGGAIRFQNPSLTGSPRVIRIEEQATLTIAPDATIYGRNVDLWSYQGMLHNKGTIENEHGVMNIRSEFMQFLNEGLVEARGSGTIQLTGTAYAQNFVGQTLSGGKWHVRDSGRIRFSSTSPTITINEADVLLAGTDSQFLPINTLESNQGAFRLLEGRIFNASAFANDGVLEVGVSSELVASVSFEQGAEAELVIGLGSTEPGGFGRITTPGHAALSGDLRLVRDGYEPTAGDRFEIVSAGSISGEFANIVLVDGGPFRAVAEYLRDRVWIEIVGIPGWLCYANCDNSEIEPILNVDDFTCFINEFATAQALPPAQQIEHYANCDQSTSIPVLTIDDFTCFINAFVQGCD